MMKAFPGALLSLASILAMPAMAQDKTPFQGDWLGWGCFGKGAPLQVSFSIVADTAILHGLITNKRSYTFAKPADPVFYSALNGERSASFTFNKNGFKFVMSISSDRSTHGKMDDTSLKFSHGPASDLQKFGNAHSPFCSVQ